MTGPGTDDPRPLPPEIDEIIGHTGDISLTIEDVILLILSADDRPVKGLGRMTGEVLLTLKEVLNGPDVEPAVFKSEPDGPHSEDVELALDGLDFSNSVTITGSTKDASAMRFKIAPRGRIRIREKWNALPVCMRQALSRKRVEWDTAEPVAMKEPEYVHNKELLKGGSQAAPPRGQGGQHGPDKPPAGSGSGGEPRAAKRQEYMDHGDRLYDEERYGEAYATYKLALKSNVPDADLHIRMARSLMGDDLYKDALKHCRAAIGAHPAGADGYITMGYCLHRLGRHAEVLSYARHAARLGPSDPRPYILCGVAMNHLGRHAEALSHHQRAMRLNPSGVNAHQNASFSLFHLGRYEEALRQSEMVAKMVPEDAVAHGRIALCLSQMGRHEDAIPAGRRAIEAAPNRIEFYFPLITSLLRLGRHEEVVECCARATEANALDPQPYFTMALSLRALGRSTEALPFSQRAVELDPTDTDYRTALSYLLRDLGRLSEALFQCQKAVSNDSDHLLAHSNMGSVLADMGRHEEALACFDSALRIDPQQTVQRYNRALSLQATGHLGKAVEEYKKVVGIDPDNAAAYNNMGTVLASLGRGTEALAHFDRALELSPSNAETHYNKANSLLNLNLYSEALAHFDRALELSPSNTAARVGRISCLDGLRLPDRAVGRYAGEVLGPVAPQVDAAPGTARRPAAALTAVAPERTGHRSGPPPEADLDAGRVQRVESLLSQDESEVLEFKTWTPSHLKSHLGSNEMKHKIVRELCSFANTMGGDLLIGVNDSGKVEGLMPGGGRLSRKERDETLAWMTNVVVGYFGVEHDHHFDRAIVEVGDVDILHCIVTASKDGPVTLKRRLEEKHDIFMRAGSTCRPLGAREMLEYIKLKWPEWPSQPQPMGKSEPDWAEKMASSIANQITTSLFKGT